MQGVVPAICLASGPSLTQEDVDYCRNKGVVISVNDCYRLAPFSNALYAADLDWWDYHNGAVDFLGAKYTVNENASKKYGIHLLNPIWYEKFYAKGNSISLGKNSGFQAMCLAALLGHKRIILLGYNMQPVDNRRHWFGDHPARIQRNSNYAAWVKCFEEAAPIIKQQRIEVINCTTNSALTCFPFQDLRATI